MNRHSLDQLIEDEDVRYATVSRTLRGAFYVCFGILIFSLALLLVAIDYFGGWLAPVVASLFVLVNTRNVILVAKQRKQERNRHIAVKAALLKGEIL